MNIVIYSTQTCGYCKMLKRYLDDHGMKYQEKLADSDENIAKELFEKSHGYAVPFTVISETSDDGTEKTIAEILGFDVPKVNAALGIK